MATVIEIPKNATKKQLDEVAKKLKAIPKKSIKKHFGKLKWPVDALEYQKQIRNEWN